MMKSPDHICSGPVCGACCGGAWRDMDSLASHQENIGL